MSRERALRLRPVLRVMLFACLLSAPLAGLQGCNTVEGAGEDLQAASQNTRNAIRNATDGERRER